MDSFEIFYWLADIEKSLDAIKDIIKTAPVRIEDSEEIVTELIDVSYLLKDSAIKFKNAQPWIAK